MASNGDPVMPDPYDMKVAPKVDEPITGPLPDGDASINTDEVEIVQPEDSPAENAEDVKPDPTGAEDAAKVKEPEPVEDAPEDTPADAEAEAEEGGDDWRAQWDKGRQRDDEEDAKNGLSKSDLRAKVEELERSISTLQAKGAEKEPAIEQATDIELLPEADEYGEKIDANIRHNKMARELQRLRADQQQLLSSEQLRVNKEAFFEIIDAATAKTPLLRNDLISMTRAEWKRRGYTTEYYPNAEQTADIVDSIRTRLLLDRAKQEVAKLRKGATVAPEVKAKKVVSDTAKGGRKPPREQPHVIELDFNKAVRKQKQRGDFADILG